MIDIRGIRKYVEDNINKEVDEIDQPNLNREKKKDYSIKPNEYI